MMAAVQNLEVGDSVSKLSSANQPGSNESDAILSKFIHSHKSHKMLKSQSTSEWSVLMKIVNNHLAMLDTKPELLSDIMVILDKIVIQLEIDKKLLAEGVLDKISDCALHAPRDSNSQFMKSKPIRPAHYCAKKMFIDSGKMPKQEWANIHWQRVVAKLSRAFIEQEKIKAIQAAEFKTA